MVEIIKLLLCKLHFTAKYDSVKYSRTRCKRLFTLLLLSFHTKHATLKNMAIPLLKNTPPTTLSPLVYSAFHLSKITLEPESVFRDLIDKSPMPSRNILRGEKGYEMIWSY